MERLMPDADLSFMADATFCEDHRDADMERIEPGQEPLRVGGWSWRRLGWLVKQWIRRLRGPDPAVLARARWLMWRRLTIGDPDDDAKRDDA
jgi:hypothetical protein